MWTLLIIIATILIGLFIYYYYFYPKVEKFSENIQDHVDGLAQLLTAVGSGNIPETSPYVEKLAEIPSNSSLKLYLTSFSARTHYDNSVRVYNPEMQRWNNFISANQSFFVKGAQEDLTVSLRENGMKLKNVALEGLRADELNMTDYSLKSFSATFFMIFKGSFTIPANCELFTISLEAPNYARLTLIDDESKCKFELQIGESDDANKITTDSISKDILMSGDPVAITIKCDIDSSNIIKANIFIKKTTLSGSDTIATFTSDQSITLSTGNKLILGNSRMSINKNQTPLDANLLAFMFFSSPLSEDTHTSVTTYLATQNRSDTGLLSTLNTTAANQLQSIRELIANNTATQGTLQAQLDACKASIPPVVKAFGHKITMDGISSVSKEDLRSCSVLEVKQRLQKAVDATSGEERFQIKMPPGSPSTTAIAP